MRISVESEVRAQFGGSLPTNTDVFVYERGTTQEVTVYADRIGAATLVQPLLTNGVAPGYVDAEALDLVVDGGPPAEWEAAPGAAFADGGFRAAGAPWHAAEESEAGNQFVIGDYPEPGSVDRPMRFASARFTLFADPFNSEPSENVSRVAGMAAYRSTEVVDPAESRVYRSVGENNFYRTGVQTSYKRRYPAGWTTQVAKDFDIGHSELWVVHGRFFPNAVKAADLPSGVTFQADDQPVTYDTQTGFSMAVCGHHPAGETEIIVDDAIARGVPAQAAGRAARTTVAWENSERYVTLAADAESGSIQFVGSSTLRGTGTVEDVAKLPPTGTVRVATINGIRYRRYDSVAKAGTIATFTLSAEHALNRNVLDGAEITMDRLLGVTSQFESWVNGHETEERWQGYLPGATELEVALDPANTEMMDAWDLVPDSGELLIEEEVRNPTGAGLVDRPVRRVPYVDKQGDGTPATPGKLILAAPFAGYIEDRAWIRIEGVPGLVRALGNPGAVRAGSITLHRLNNVAGIAGPGERFGVCAFDPRYRGWGRANQAVGFFAGDAQSGTGGAGSWIGHLGFVSLRDTPQDSSAHGEGRIVTTIDGNRTGIAWWREGKGGIYGSRMLSVPEQKYKWNVGGPRARIKPPNVAPVEEDPDDTGEPPPEGEDPGDEGSGFFSTGTLFVRTVNDGPWPSATFYPAARKLAGEVYNRHLGLQALRLFDYVAAEQHEALLGRFTSLSLDENSLGRSTLNGDHSLPAATLALSSAAGFATPASAHTGKWRAKAAVGGSVIARGTYAAKSDQTLTSVLVTEGSGMLPSGTVIEEDYALSDFWWDNGLNVFLADSVAFPFMAATGGIAANADRPGQILIDLIGPLGEPGVRLGLNTPLDVFRRSDGKVGAKHNLTGEQTLASEEWIEAGLASHELVATNGITVGNDQAASALGNVVGKTEVFDAEGNSLGYLPIFDEITDEVVGVPIEQTVVRIAEFEGLRWLEPLSGADVWLLEPGALDRADGVDGSDPTAVAAFLVGETEIDVFEDRNLGIPITQPLTTDVEGRIVGFTAVRQYDTYVPADPVHPIQVWDASSGRGAKA